MTKGPIILTDQQVIQQRTDFESSIRAQMLSDRLIAWNFHYVTIAVTLILIYPSQYMINLQKYAEDNQLDGLVAMWRSLIYYSFFGGTYHD